MIVCYEIGGSRIRAAASAAPGVIAMLGERQTPVNDEAGFLAALRDLAPDGVQGAAISIAGVVDPATGRLRVANLPCLDGKAVGDLVLSALGCPVVVANDADCFTLAEAGTGAGRGHGTVFGIILGTGIGGGLVIDGRLVTGPGGYAGEWGHGTVLRGGMRVEGVELPELHCGCGLHGCLDTLGARGIERLHHGLTGVQRRCEDIVAGWGVAREPEARTIRIWLDVMSGVLAMLVNVTGASIVPAGGGLAGDERLIAALDAAVRRRVLRDRALPIVVPAAHLQEPGLIGASLLGHEAFGDV